MTDEQQEKQFYRDTESLALPKLDDHRLSLLRPLAQPRFVKCGEPGLQSPATGLWSEDRSARRIQLVEQRDGYRAASCYGT